MPDETQFVVGRKIRNAGKNLGTLSTSSADEAHQKAELVLGAPGKDDHEESVVIGGGNEL